MFNMFSPFSWFILVCVGIGLILLAYFLFTMGRRKIDISSELPKGKPGAPGVCPVCCTVLQKDEQLKTKVYPSSDSDRLCSIYGCPHCYPVPESGISRQCPVCRTAVETDGYLVARLFDRGQMGKHVRILGCKRCRKG